MRTGSGRRAALALALMAFLMYSCGGTDIPDQVPPTVAATTPADNATNVAIDAAVSVTFSEAIATATINADHFSLSDGEGAVPGTVSYADKVARFTPASPLAYSTRYTATVAADVTDLAGNPMADSLSWSFTTRAAPDTVRVLYLHHSTGGVIWEGDGTHTVPGGLASYNSAHGTHYEITELAYPNGPYPWDNYPYDYWNLWVKNPGYLGQPTLADFMQNYDVIVFKHCFPVSGIKANTGSASVSSSRKSIENYQLQYDAIKGELIKYPSKKFIVWTGAALREQDTNADDAGRARSFFNWVKTSWDTKGDNIFVWDFFALETNNGMYLAPANATGDSHPNSDFAGRVAPLFVKRLVDVIEGRGYSGSLTGE